MSAATITAAGMRMIKLLAGQPSRTISELMSETNVTRTAITEQLRELEDAGYVLRTIEPLSGRGRPRHRYSATHAALVLLFASNQQVLVPAIWKAIHSAGGDKLTQKVRHGVRASLLEHYQSRITASDPQDRLAQYIAILEVEGGLVDLDIKADVISVSKRSCPFISMFETRRNVCTIDLELMSSIAGCPVRQVACRHDGDPCCRFEVDAHCEAKPQRERVAEM